jgi:uncharacterized protein DUF4282/zinc ribbon protein
MAFCAQCGSQLSPGAAACSACGAATGAGAPAAAAAPAPARYVPPVNAQQAAGFINSLFDLSFTKFFTPGNIPVLFVITLVIAGLGALGLILSAFNVSSTAGILMLLIVAPLMFFFEVIYARVIMEVLIVIHRGGDHLAEIAKQGRR